MYSSSLPHTPNLDALRGVTIALFLLQHLRVPGMEASGTAGVRRGTS